MAKKQKIKLKNILSIHPNMKILIDDCVETDEDGNYLINVGYERVSTDKQAEEGYGLDVQEKELCNYAKYKKFPNFVVFIDDGYTGTEFQQRPALNLITEMIENFNNKKSNIRIKCFVVPRIDRLGRSMLGILQFVQDYLLSEKDAKFSTKNKNQKDIDFISLKEESCSIKSDNPMGKMTLMLFAMLAEYDRDNIVLRMREGKVARLKSGKWLGGGNIPYGYYYDKESGKLQINESEAEKIRELFRLYIDEHMSPNEIAETLDFKSDVIVRNIINRKSLTGCIVYKDDDGVEQEVPNAHKPIIPLHRWEEGQEEMAKRSTNRGDSENMLMGLCYCGECGGKMRYQKYGKYHKLVCYSHYKSSKKSLVKDPNCPNITFVAHEVENTVIEYLFKFNYVNNSNIVKESNVSSHILEKLNNQLKELDKQSDNIRNNFKYVNDENIIKDLAKDLEDLEIQKIALRRKIEREERDQSIKIKADKAIAILSTLKSAFPNMTKKEKQVICRELIDRISIDKSCNIKIHLKLQNYIAAKQNN